MINTLKKMVAMILVIAIFLPMSNIEASSSIHDNTRQRTPGIFKKVNRIEMLIDKLSESEEIYEAIKEYDEMTIEFANLFSEKEATAAASGNDDALELTDEEFEYFKEWHNELIETIGIKDKHLVEITRNKDTVLDCIIVVYNQLEDIKAERMLIDEKVMEEWYIINSED